MGDSPLDLQVLLQSLATLCVKHPECESWHDVVMSSLNSEKCFAEAFWPVRDWVSSSTRQQCTQLVALLCLVDAGIEAMRNPVAKSSA